MSNLFEETYLEDIKANSVIFNERKKVKKDAKKEEKTLKKTEGAISSLVSKITGTPDEKFSQVASILKSILGKENIADKKYKEKMLNKFNNIFNKFGLRLVRGGKEEKNE